MRKIILSFLVFVALAIGFSASASANTQIHIVKSGDTMWKISKQYNVPFSEILKLNKAFKNPSLIYPNDRIIIPQTNTSTNDQPQTQTSKEVSEVLKLVNEERKKQGLNSLRLSIKLNEVAYAKSKDMAVNRYFSHQSPTYGSPFDMLKKFGVSYKTAGENIASGQRTPAEVMNAWMNSSGHRANILNKNYTELGVGYYSGGQYRHYWTQTFIGR